MIVYFMADPSRIEISILYDCSKKNSSFPDLKIKAYSKIFIVRELLGEKLSLGLMFLIEIGG